MAFGKNSRYRDVPTVDALDAAGRPVTALKLRHAPAIEGDPVTVEQNDRLDLLAGARYHEPTWFWHIADVNSAVDARRLTALDRKGDHQIRLPRP
jgi:hypothetical protein